jgi:preprotein translocase subunit SecG
MENLIIAVHIIICLALISLVLLQDSKGGAMGGTFGGGSNSVFGPIGATTLAQKVTRIFAIFFALSCIVLTAYYKKDNSSVIDKLPVEASKPTETTPAAPTNVDAAAATATSTTTTTTLVK